MSEIALRNVCKQFDSEHYGVKDFNLDIHDKEFVIFVGPSGCGKSTTLRLIAGLEEITDGELWIDGKLCNYLEPKERDMSMVFQNYALYPNMTVYGNIAYSLKIRKVPKKEIDQKVRQVAKILEIDSLLDRKPVALSGGQKQRVSIAGVLAMHPKCIVLDEPTAMLDPSGRKEVIRAVRGLNQVEGVTLILITHYMEEIIHADKVFVMDEGKIAMQGTPREIFSQVEQLKKLRLDVPQVTLLSYELQKRGIPLPDGILTREELVSALGYGKTDRK